MIRFTPALIVIITCFLFYTEPVKGQDLPKYVILWNPSRPLQWSDFKGPQAHLEGDQAAQVETGLKMNLDYNKKQDTAIIDIISYMDPKKSSKRKDASGDYLLRHEQLHFDICEWYARMLRKEISLLKCAPELLAKNVIKLYDKLTKEQSNTQRLYDKETRHSLNKEKQAEWDQKITQGLKGLEEYKQTRILLAL